MKFLLLALCLLLSSPAYAQEVEIPQYTPFIDAPLPPMVRYEQAPADAPRLRANSYNVRSRLENGFGDEAVSQTELVRSISGCILTPIPIDRRFAGCKINFAPTPVYANLH